MLVNKTETLDPEEKESLLALERLSKEELEAEHSRLLATCIGPDGRQDFKSIALPVLRKVFTITAILRKQKGGPPRTKAPAMRDEDIF